MAPKGGYVKKDLLGPILRHAIKGLSGSRIISGSLSVAPGHEYWWFLEYGTGQFYEPSDDMLQEPPAVARHYPSGGPYEIPPKATNERGVLVYMTKWGERRRVRGSVTHPGISPRGFVRLSVLEARKDLAKYLDKELKRRIRTKRLAPTREELVELVNEVFLMLLQRLEIRTPDDSDPDPFHSDYRPRRPPLARAWRITPAE